MVTIVLLTFSSTDWMHSSMIDNLTISYFKVDLWSIFMSITFCNVGL